jgi:uncharacterized protein
MQQRRICSAATISDRTVELLLASITALLLGPVFGRLSAERPQWLALLDGVVLVSLLGLITVELLPAAFLDGGGWALGAAIFGVVLPPTLDRWFGDVHGRVHGTMLWLAMVGLAIHAMMDGAALVAGGAHEHHDHGELLGLGVVLHRIPLGLTIWWAVRPHRGRRAAISIIAAITVATVVGFIGAKPLIASLPLRMLAIFQALVAGSLLHVVVGHHPRTMQRIIRDHRGWSAIGAAIGAAALAAVVHAHPHPGSEGVLSAGETFLTLAQESAPALLLAFAGAGLLRGVLQRASTQWLAGGGALRQAGKGMLFGLPLPICSCGVLPVYRTLVQRGAPVAAAVAFLIATPELGLDALLITVPLLGTKMAIARLVAAAIVAIAVAVAIGRLAPSRAHDPVEPEAETHEVRGNRLVAGLRFGFGELADHIAPWIMVGLAIAALLEPLLRDDWLATLPPGLDVPVAAIVGLPGYVCASGATPLAAILMHKGLSAGGAIAFLLTGPATNVTTFAVLASLHGRRFAFAFAAGVTLLAVALGFGVNLWLGPQPALPLHAAAAEGASTLEAICLGAIAIVVAGSIWRQGPRGFLGQILTPGAHEHDHGHSHEHEHEHESTT